MSQGQFGRDSRAMALESELDRAIERNGSDLYDTLMNAIDDPDPEVRSTVAYGLGELRDDRAVAPLLDLLDHDPDETVVEHSLKSLESYHNQCVQESLLREEPRARDRRAIKRMVAQQLGRYDSEASVDALVQLMSHWDAAVRDAALESLLCLRPGEAARWDRLYRQTVDDLPT